MKQSKKFLTRMSVILYAYLLGFVLSFFFVSIVYAKDNMINHNHLLSPVPHFKPINNQHHILKNEQPSNKHKKSTKQLPIFLRLPDLGIGKEKHETFCKTQLTNSTLFESFQNPEIFLYKSSQLVANKGINEKSLEKISKDQFEIVKDNALNIANSKINTIVKESLQPLGSVRLNFSLNNKGSLEKIDLNLLSKLKDNQKSHLFFTQNGLSKQGLENRLVGNFGIGYRYNSDDYLIGLNSFIDHDFTGENTRFSLGTELWTDYIKLSANYYHRLSDWRNSFHLAGYDERPATGYDLRANFYLNSYPHISGDFMFEKYLGNEVALFNNQDKKKNPHAISAAIVYTPVPLFNLSSGYKFRQEGTDETYFNLSINYKLGIPLEEQLNPNKVVENLSLNRSRYDLVERNNQLILEYKKKKFEITIKPRKYTTSEVQHEYIFKTDDVIDIESIHNSSVAIKNYFWSVTPENQSFSQINSSMNYLSLLGAAPGVYYIQLTMNNDLDIIAVSNVIKIRVEPPSSSPLALQINFINRTDDKVPFDFNLDGKIDHLDTDLQTNSAILHSPLEDMHKDLSTFITQKYIHFTVAILNDHSELESTIGTKPQIYYLSNNLEYEIDEKSESITLVNSYPDPTNPNLWHYIIASNKQEIQDQKIQIFATLTSKNEESLQLVHSELKPVIFTKNNAPNTPIKSLLRIRVYDVGTQGNILPSEDRIILDSFTNLTRPLKKDTYYQVVISESQQPDTKLSEWFDITAQVQNSIVWRYYNPKNKEEIIEDNYPAEGIRICKGFTKFKTQKNNFSDNSISHKNFSKKYTDKQRLDNAHENAIDITSEQNLMLAVQIDISQRNYTENELNLSKIFCKQNQYSSPDFYDSMIAISSKPIDFSLP